jgi:hypothetical protein
MWEIWDGHSGMSRAFAEASYISSIIAVVLPERPYHVVCVHYIFMTGHKSQWIQNRVRFT